MKCPRCSNAMIGHSFISNEEVAGISFRVTEEKSECPKCSAIVHVFLPTTDPPLAVTWIQGGR